MITISQYPFPFIPLFSTSKPYNTLNLFPFTLNLYSLLYPGKGAVARFSYVDSPFSHYHIAVSKGSC